MRHGAAQCGATGLAPGGGGGTHGLPFVLTPTPSCAGLTIDGSASTSSVLAASTLAATPMPLKPSGCAAHVVCAQWWAAVPSGRVAMLSSASGTAALTSPMSDDAV